jgi:hypothetical protein
MNGSIRPTMKVLNMKKLLLVLILSLFSFNVFSEDLSSEVKRGTVKTFCLELNRDIYDTTHDISRTRKEFLNEKDKQVKKESHQSLQTIQDIQKDSIDTWQKLGCAGILYK